MSWVPRREEPQKPYLGQPSVRKSCSLKAFPSFHFTSSHDCSFSDNSVCFALLFLPAETGAHRSASSNPAGFTVVSSVLLKGECCEYIRWVVFKSQRKFCTDKLSAPSSPLTQRKTRLALANIKNMSCRTKGKIVYHQLFFPAPATIGWNLNSPPAQKHAVP